MPIFVSRFSPERSLIGNLISPSSRRNETPERSASQSQTSPALSGSSPQDADRVKLVRDLTSLVSTDEQSTRSAPVSVSDLPADKSPQSSSKTIGSLTLLDQLRLRRNGANPIQKNHATEHVQAVENPVDAPAPSPSVGIETSLGPLAKRLRELTDQLTANRFNSTEAVPEVEVAAVENLAAENQTATASAVEDKLDRLITTLQKEQTVEIAVVDETILQAEPTINVVVTTAQKSTGPTREDQQQTLRDDLQTIASGLKADAAIESRKNAESASRNAEAAGRVQSRREVQQNQREIQSLQADRRAAQQDARSADQAIRQLQSRNTRIQSESTKQSSPGSSLDLLAQ